MKKTSKLTFRGIQGMFYSRLESNPNPIVSDLAMLLDSDQSSEDYTWLGMAPGLQKRVGGLKVSKLKDYSYTIPNDLFEAAIEISRFDREHDKTGQIEARINDLADRTSNHPAELVLSLISGGETNICYDKQYFFDTDHKEGKSGTQSNKLSYDIAAAVPTAGEMESAIMKAVEGLISLKDDQGEPLNEYAKNFRVVVPISLLTIAGSALKNPVIVEGGTSRTNSIATNVAGFNFSLHASPRINWSNKFAIFRTDATAKPFIVQDVDPVELQELGEGSDYFVQNDAYLEKVRVVRGAGYGFWQYGIQQNLT